MALVAVITGLVGLWPLVWDHRFYYIGDQVESFGPLWVLLGRYVEGNSQIPLMDPLAWAGGNFAGEAAAGVWNPASWATWFIASGIDNLALAGAVVSVLFLVLLAIGVYGLARTYDAAIWIAIAVAIAVPFSGFTLRYEASGWPVGLAAFTWVTYFWWSMAHAQRHQGSPLWVFVAGFLAITTGNPYAALGMLIVALGLMGESLAARDLRETVRVGLRSMSGVAAALLVYLPLLAAVPVSNRQTLAAIANDTFMVPGIGDLLTSSAVSYVPAITNWGGALRETKPVAYLAWFLVPLLPWIRWRAAGVALLERTGILFTGGLFLLLVLGPSNLWLFRWPLRLIEYLYLAVAVAFAVAATAGLARDHRRLRAVFTLGLALLGAYLAWAVWPEGSLLPIHLIATILTVALLLCAWFAWQHGGTTWLAAVLVLGTALVMTFQAVVFPRSMLGEPEKPADTQSQLAEIGREYRGLYLQLADFTRRTPDEVRSGEIVFGSQPALVHYPAINRYTGIGFQAFEQALCIDYRGSVCPEAFGRLWQPTSAEYPQPLVDTLAVSTLSIQKSLVPGGQRDLPPEGWRVLNDTPSVVVWTRDAPLPTGRAIATRGVRVTQSSTDGATVDSNSGGRVVFNRLAWPGAEASIDGQTVVPTIGPAGLVEITVPGGRHTLEVRYRTPGLPLGAGVLLAGLTLAVVLEILRRRGRRHRDDSDPDLAEESQHSEVASGV
jgi:hypothetical protein